MLTGPKQAMQLQYTRHPVMVCTVMVTMLGVADGRERVSSHANSYPICTCCFLAPAAANSVWVLTCFTCVQSHVIKFAREVMHPPASDVSQEVHSHLCRYIDLFTVWDESKRVEQYSMLHFDWSVAKESKVQVRSLTCLTSAHLLSSVLCISGNLDCSSVTVAMVQCRLCWTE